MSFPRILMISDEGPQTGTAGGLLLHRLFSDYPPDRLLVTARYVPTIGEPLPGVSYKLLQTPWTRFEKSRFNRLKRSLRAFGLTPPVSTRLLDKLMDGFRPELILCVMQHAACYDAAANFARKNNLPLVAIIHDINDSFEPVLPWAREAARLRDAAFYRQACRRLCISPEMEQHFYKRFGVPGHVLYPNRNPELKPIPFDLALKLRNPERLTLGFAGNLNYGYGREICRLLPALRSTGTRLVIYSRSPGPDCSLLAEANDCVELRGFLPDYEVWSAMQRDCDAVWLPYPIQAPDYETLYSTHFPSKLPEYLALGLPVLISGPYCATGLGWAKKNPEATAFMTAPTLDEATSMFRRLGENTSWRRDLASQGYAAGCRDFDPLEIVRQFQQHLRDAAINTN